MADENLASHGRDPIKSSVGNVAAHRRRQHAVMVGKERMEALVRTKRLCRVGVSGDAIISLGSDMMIDEEQSVLEVQTISSVEELKIAISYQEKGAVLKRVTALRELRRLLSRSEFPPVEAALKAGAIPLLVQCLSFGSSDEQLLDAAWCLTNIAAGKPEETKALLPVLPLLVAHLGVNYSSFGPMIESIGQYGPGMKPPSYHETRVTYLKKELAHTNDLMKDHRENWVKYGCSIMADGWTDGKGRTLINFLVNCPKGSMFIESIDASSYSKDGQKLFELLDKYVELVGEANVVQIVTDNASANILAGT